MTKCKVLTTLVAVGATILTSAVTPAAARWGGGGHGGWRGAGIAAGIATGLALGAAAANGGYPYYSGYGYPYGYYSRYGYGRGRCFSSPAEC
jgi:hypothetical protein